MALWGRAVRRFVLSLVIITLIIHFGLGVIISPRSGERAFMFYTSCDQSSLLEQLFPCRYLTSCSVCNLYLGRNGRKKQPETFNCSKETDMRGTGLFHLFTISLTTKLPVKIDLTFVTQQQSCCCDACCSNETLFLLNEWIVTVFPLLLNI